MTTKRLSEDRTEQKMPEGVFFVKFAGGSPSEEMPNPTDDVMSEAWRLCVYVRGEIRSHAMRFARKKDADTALQSLNKHGIGTWNEWVKVDWPVKRQIMVEAMSW